MHGLVNKALQSFVTHTYGPAVWSAVAETAGLDFDNFEGMLTYEDALTDRLVEALRLELSRDPQEILEDVGTFLVSDPASERLRRLLRFCGVSYVEFLHSLDELPERVRLAVSDLDLPMLELREHAADRYSLTCGDGIPYFSSVMIGVLRAMADDYGALVTLDRQHMPGGGEAISIELVETAFAEGREFDLGARAAQ